MNHTSRRRVRTAMPDSVGTGCRRCACYRATRASSPARGVLRLAGRATTPTRPPGHSHPHRALRGERPRRRRLRGLRRALDPGGGVARVAAAFRGGRRAAPRDVSRARRGPTNRPGRARRALADHVRAALPGHLPYPPLSTHDRGVRSGRGRSARAFRPADSGARRVARGAAVVSHRIVQRARGARPQRAVEERRHSAAGAGWPAPAPRSSSPPAATSSARAGAAPSPPALSRRRRPNSRTPRSLSARGRARRTRLGRGRRAGRRAAAVGGGGGVTGGRRAAPRGGSGAGRGGRARRGQAPWLGGRPGRGRLGGTSSTSSAPEPPGPRARPEQAQHVGGGAASSARACARSRPPTAGAATRSRAAASAAARCSRRLGREQADEHGGRAVESPRTTRRRAAGARSSPRSRGTRPRRRRRSAASSCSLGRRPASLRRRRDAARARRQPRRRRPQRRRRAVRAARGRAAAEREHRVLSAACTSFASPFDEVLEARRARRELAYRSRSTARPSRTTSSGSAVDLNCGRPRRRDEHDARFAERSVVADRRAAA